MFPLPQPLPLTQPPSEDNIKDNLQKYSPFYKQAMFFDETKVETLFYVAHDGFSSEKAVEKFKAFDLFKDKKIVFAEFQKSEDRLKEIPAERLLEGDHIMDIEPGTRAAIMASDAISEPSAHQNGPGDHFTVKVKMPDNYEPEELIIYGDGKCGIVASIVALKEIDSNWVLFYDVDTENEKIVKSDPNHPYDKLLHKENKQEVIHYKGLEAPQYGDEKLHYHVSADLDLVRSSGWFSSLEDSLRNRVSALLENTDQSNLLTPKEVHEIISTNVAQLEKVADISPQHIHAVSSEETLARGAVAVIPPSVLKGEKKEGIELRKDAKHEFKIIVLNILHEWIEGKDCEFSKINEDDFLKDLIAQKLGDEYAGKIQTAFGGDKITFKSLLAIGDSPELSKEREAFYSAQCSFDAVAEEVSVSENPSNKVWERIKDIVDKYNSTEVFQTTNTDFNASFNGALKKIKEIPTVDGDSIDSTLLGFDDKIGKITRVPQARTSAELLGEIFNAQTDPTQPAHTPRDPTPPAHTPRDPTPPAPATRAPAPPAAVPPAAVPPAPRALGLAPRDPTPPALAPRAPTPTANPFKAEANDSLGQLENFMQTAQGFIGKVFEDLGEGIKKSCEEARENLLEKVKKMEEQTQKPGNATGKQGDKEASETPDNSILTTIFSSLKSCLGEERK